VKTGHPQKDKYGRNSILKKEEKSRHMKRRRKTE
jgi:hypothetical protein